MKITAQLIDGKSDRHIWADSYERELASVLAIQNDVARAIAREVDVRLTPEGNARLLAATRSVLPAVYDAYVRVAMRGTREVNRSPRRDPFLPGIY